MDVNHSKDIDRARDRHGAPSDLYNKTSTAHRAVSRKGKDKTNSNVKKNVVMEAPDSNDVG